MKINSINSITKETTITLNSSELDCICDLFEVDSIYEVGLIKNPRLYADMIMCRDLTQHGNINDFSLDRIVKRRKISKESESE